MSFILDALRKSETERQQQGSAEFAGVPTGTRRTEVPRWLWVVAFLLLINLTILIALLLRPDTDTTPRPQFGATPDELSLDRNAAADDNNTAPNFASQVEMARQNPPEQQASGPQTETPDDANAVRPVVISQDPAAIRTSNIHPTIHEMRASGTMSLPELHLDIHVYSEVPKDRFVFINMSKHREGSQLDEGPVVAEITTEGVLLGHHGTLFLLPRE